MCADTIAPNVTYCLSSNNSNHHPELARAGDMITVAIYANEAINTPSVTCSGIAFAVSAVGTGSVNYTATHVVQSTDVNVLLSCTISFTDLAGNTGLQWIDTTQTCTDTIGEATQKRALMAVCLSHVLENLCACGVCLCLSLQTHTAT